MELSTLYLIQILEAREKLSDEVLYFIATSLHQNKKKYSYSYTINSTKLKKQKILLPINRENKPDYEYMKQYIKNLMIKKYNEYLEHQKK